MADSSTYVYYVKIAGPSGDLKVTLEATFDALAVTWPEGLDWVVEKQLHNAVTCIMERIRRDRE